MYANRAVLFTFTKTSHPVYGILVVIILGSCIFPLSGTGSPYPHSRDKGRRIKRDTVFISKGSYFLSKTLRINIPHDTFYVPPLEKGLKTDSAGYEKSRVFYDTIFKKLSRKRITRLLYPLAFRQPKQSNLADTVQILNNVSPFEGVKGKVVRNIRVVVLAPFGSSIYDTCSTAQTGTGKALNRLHMKTREHVIRRNLLFKKGDRLDPGRLADNERILRDLNAVDNARILVTETTSGSDTVDLLVLVKDVWSIGIDVPLITSSRLGFRIYDANFLGFTDKITVKMSLGLNRAPFFRMDGLSYTYTNIAGSFISASFDYSADDRGNRRIAIGFDRSFITNHTKWAGGINGEWKKDVNTGSANIKTITYSEDENLWLGRAFLLSRQGTASRIVVAAGVSKNDYLSRPFVSRDSNTNYYNYVRVLTTLSLSKNNYYLTDYLLEFGKTENLAYGHLFQVTAGTDNNDFYSRFYSCIHLSSGNYYNRFGYIAGYVKFGGFLNKSSFEDAFVKINLLYFTPLLKSADKRYRFRTFFQADYRYTINPRLINNDLFNANQIFNISKVGNIKDFEGMKFISARAASKCFTPWYFYGFRFAITAAVQAGIVATKSKPLTKASVFTGVGIGLTIKNDNLVLPALNISGYYYPTTAGNFPQFQIVTNSSLNISSYNFNVGAPYEESLGN
ncbi:MAG: hypothetical protein WCK34_08915 [Bacteroidota bacterium]